MGHLSMQIGAPVRFGVHTIVSWRIAPLVEAFQWLGVIVIV